MFCGIDWAENHHDIAVVDHDGTLKAKERIPDDLAGYGRLLELMAEYGDRPDQLVPVAIETTRGLLVAALRATGRPVFAINPLAVARYRERHSVSGRKSDHGDALVLANILRTDLAAHRALPNDSELAQAVAVLARAQQDAVWARIDAHNELRSVLREFYPSILAAFAQKRGGIMRAEARLILAAAPTPSQAAGLTVSQIRSQLLGGRCERASLLDTLTAICRLTDAGGHFALVDVEPCATLDDSANHSLLLSCGGRRSGRLREPLEMRSLGCVLAATVRGAQRLPRPT